MTRAEQLLIRNICLGALQSSKDFSHRRQRVEVAVVDDVTLRIKVASVVPGAAESTAECDVKIIVRVDE
jgi:hypothetical protein